MQSKKEDKNFQGLYYKAHQEIKFFDEPYLLNWIRICEQEINF